MKFVYRNHGFWHKKYYINTVGGYKQAVQKYIENQETEVLILAHKCYDPFEKWPKSNWNKKDNSKRK